jgi:hypothetical protein
MECSPYFSVYSLFNYAASSFDYVASNDKIISEE